MYEPTVDPYEDIERELLFSAREISAGFVARASLDPREAVKQIMGRQRGRHAHDPHPPKAAGQLILSGLARRRR